MLFAFNQVLPLFVLAGLLAGCSDTSDRRAPASSEGVWFKDEAAARGLDFLHASGFDGRYWLPEIATGGGALADLDGDGDLDAYLVQGGKIAGDGDDVPGNRLYFNRGDGHFVAAAEPGAAADRGYGMGVTAGDYDNDGDIDLYVTNWGPNVLLRNVGDGRFEDVTAVAGVGDPGWGTAAVFLDLDKDSDLDLFLVNYLNWDPASAKECFSVDVRTYCGPVSDDASGDRLFRNNGDGTFTDVSSQAGLNATVGTGLGVVGADFNDDGLADVFVANDGMVNQLWMNQGGLRFADEAFLWGCAMDDHGIAKAGMGVASSDFDDDGDADLLVVNLEAQTDSFYRNEGTHFVDATSRVGLGVSSRRFTRFGTALADFDNDGDLDLYEANGRVEHTPEQTGPDVFAEPNTLYRGVPDGRFELVDPEGGTAPLVHTSRGVAMGDVDGDGGIDLLVVNRDAPAYLLMNRVADRGNWARFSVLNRSGRDAHAAIVSATISTSAQQRRQRRDVQTAGSYLASHDPRVHFGLGRASRILGVKVRWPTGELETFGDFDAGDIQLRFGAGRTLAQ